MKTRQNTDPRWIKARFGSVCGCGHTIKKGADIFYYPSARKAVCKVCGEIGAADLQAELHHEMSLPDSFKEGL